MRKYLLAGAALAVLAGGSARASVITSASLFSPLPPSGSSTVVVGLQGVAGPSSATLRGTGYTVTFNVGANQGVVQGALDGQHAVPVAGTTANGAATYLTGDFGSTTTSSVAASGNYLSTGAGTITITFDAPKTSLALLWGSIDRGNQVSFNDAAGDTVTGATVQGLASGFAGNGYQGPAGSAYVTATTDTPFTSVTLTSDVVSFEAAGIAASTGSFTAVPEPASLALLGAGLVGIGVGRRRRATR